MAAYLTLAEFKLESTMANTAIDELEATSPGFLDRRLATVSDRVDASLRKRYPLPLTAPYPPTVLQWVTALVTRDAYLKRGVDPNDLAWLEIKPAAELAETQLTAVSNGETGLLELPARADQPSTSGATKGGPFGYSEQSPYVGFDVQAQTAYDEDRNGRGTGDG